MIIAITGVDGSGKTTIAKSLARLLAKKGYCTVYHEEFRYTFLNALLKWFYGERLTDATDAYLKRKDKRSFAYKFWPYILYLDCLVTYAKYRLFYRNKVIIFDRYFYDFIVAFEGLGDINPLIRRLYFALPRPDAGFMLNVSPQLSYERRKDEYPPKPLEWFESWRDNYIWLNDKIKFHSINSNRKTGETIDKILEMVVPYLPPLKYE